MNRLYKYLKCSYSKLFIWVLIPINIIVSFSHHRWENPAGLIDFDIKSYYAYLPALFIHNDLKLEFISENPQEYSKWFWPVVTETGNKCIVTSMGMSFLYSPFFLLAHLITGLTDYSRDGYSVPYAFALHFSALFYVILGLFYLRRFLLKYFSQITVFITIAIVFLGTNLLYYTSFVAPMSHAYNFGLIAIFLFYTDEWHNNQNTKNTIIIGLLSGLIVLIRPTNILIVLIFIFWNTFSISSLQDRFNLFIKNYKKISIIILLALLVWVPQLVYWKYVSGKFLYFSYGDLGAKFYWDNPQIFDILFSYRKGWYVYTPLMLVASLSIFLMLKYMKNKFLALAIFLSVNIYVQASWWCWWFGGSFGLRAFVDSYGLLALPLALLVDKSLKLKWKGLVVVVIVGILTGYNLFQTKQYNRQAIHYWWMSRTGYWMNFLKAQPANGYWETVPVPDYDKARQGVYVAKNLIDRYYKYNGKLVEPDSIVSEIKHSLTETKKIRRYSQRHDISVDSAITIEAMNIYERKRKLDQYIYPVVSRSLVDSLLNDTLYLTNNKDLVDLSKIDRYNYLYNKTIEEIKKVKF